MKALQKGFSLVELLVVVAIIGVLAGVGIVGYQGYTDSAKERVAIANFNSVKRFVETEMTLLNNNIQTQSAAIKKFGTTCTDTKSGNVQYDNTDNDHHLELFMQGIMCYFDTANGYGNSFKNPYKPLTAQVVYNQDYATTGHGQINLRVILNDAGTRAGVTISAPNAALSVAASKGGTFIIEYFDSAAIGTADEKKGKLYHLK